MKYFESHAHYDDEKYDADRDELLRELHAGGIEYIVNVGADIPSSRAAVALSESYDFIYASVGVHPHEVKTMTGESMDELETLSRKGKVVAIGEIGLDFYYDNSPRELQRKWFHEQLRFVKHINKPVIIHSRDAAAECFETIKQSSVTRGVIHCYSGSAEMAVSYAKLGFHIGIGGALTFDKTKKLVEVVKTLPIDRILLETDSPYLSPVPKRGTRNNSHNLRYVAEKISEIKQISLEKVVEETYKNSVELFSVK